MPLTLNPANSGGLKTPEAKLSPSEFAALFKLTPQAAVDYLKRRWALTLTFDWRELWQDEHATQFTISRLADLDLLQAIYDGIVASVNGDLSRRDWVKNVKTLLQKSGWWGENQVTTPTGELVKTVFDPSRLKLIFDTNTRAAYAAGQWQEIQAAKISHPYLRYITKEDARVRPEHAAWDRLTLPVDHPFWETHYPPNGWRCRCRVISISQRDYDRGVDPNGKPLNKTAPEDRRIFWTDKRTGQERLIPVGIDPGFDYNVGIASERAANLHQVIDQKLAAANPALAQAAQQAGLTEPNAPPTAKFTLAGSDLYYALIQKGDYQKNRVAYQLTENEAAAMLAYTDTSYTFINQALRSGSTDAETAALVAALRDGLPKLPPYDGGVTRAVGFDPQFYDAEFLASFQVSHTNVGNYVRWNSFVSTTRAGAEGAWQGQYQFTILNAKGVRMSPMTMHPEENEVVLMPGQIYQVVDYRRAGDRHFVTLRMIEGDLPADSLIADFDE